MNWKKMNKEAVLLFAQGNIKLDLKKPNLESYIVKSDEKEYLVKVITNRGHTILNCDCQNSLTAEVKKHLKESPICKHKLSVILFCQRGVFE